MDGSSDEGQLIYNLYYIVNSCLQVFKFKIRGYKMCTAFFKHLNKVVLKKRERKNIPFLQAAVCEAGLGDQIVLWRKARVSCHATRSCPGEGRGDSGIIFPPRRILAASLSVY